MTESWRIVFMGTSAFACPSLAALIESGDSIVGVFTQPDRPHGRGLKLKESPVKTIARQKGLQIFQPEKLNRSIELVARLSPHLIVVAAYGQILSQKILDLPEQGCINVHASLLPKYRGAAPINWALIRGEDVTGITTILMSKELDAGDILLQRKTEIHPDETAGEIHDRLAQLGAATLVDTVQKWKNREIQPRKQDHARATYAPLLKKEDGHIDWNKPAANIHNQVRGMNPWPGAYTFLNGKLLKVLRTRPVSGPVSQEPGTVLSADDEGILVAAAENALLLKEIQLEGKKRLPAVQFLRGSPVNPGARLG